MDSFKRQYRTNTVLNRRKSFNNNINCGGGGIRTPGAREDTLVFKTSAFNHSATPPILVGTFLKK